MHTKKKKNILYNIREGNNSILHKLLQVVLFSGILLSLHVQIELKDMVQQNEAQGSFAPFCAHVVQWNIHWGKGKNSG